MTRARVQFWKRYRHDMAEAYGRISNGGSIVQTACGPIQYTDFGQGPPMLIVHGSGGGYDQGEYFARLIGGNYRWIAPSRFGFLGTPVPEGADSSMQADAHACLLETLGVEQVGIVGISMGGPSSLLFAVRHEERTKSLTLISAASRAIPPRRPLVAALFNVFLDDFVYWSLVHVMPGMLLAALGVPVGVQRELTPQDVVRLTGFLDTIQPMGARRDGQMLEQAMSEIHATAIREIRVPTVVLHARDDTLVPFEHGEFAARSIPGAELIRMEKGGHLALTLDVNAAQRQNLRSFLDQHNRR